MALIYDCIFLFTELGANLAGQEGRRRDGNETEHAAATETEHATPSAVSTVNSAREHSVMQLRQENHQ